MSYTFSMFKMSYTFSMCYPWKQTYSKKPQRVWNKIWSMCQICVHRCLILYGKYFHNSLLVDWLVVFLHEWRKPFFPTQLRLWLLVTILLGKNYMSASARMKFFQRIIELLNRATRLFCFNHASAFYSNDSMLTNSKSKAHTATGNPTKNLLCHVIASRV